MRLTFFFAAIALSGTVPAQDAPPPIYSADFENFTAGAPLPFGAGSDRPSSIDSNLTARVENPTTVPAGTPTLPHKNFVRLQEACDEAPSLAFDKGISLGTTETPNALAHVGVDVLFENIESYQIVFRNGAGSGIPGPASQRVADIDFVPGPVAGIGNAHFSSLGSSTTIAYQAGVPIHIDAYFDLGANLWYVDVNGSRIVSRAAISDSPLGFVGIGFNFSAFCNPPATISTVAAGIGHPAAVAVYDGFVYVADRQSHVIWKINPSTQAKEVVAGSFGVDPVTGQQVGESGYSADGTLATEAKLHGPSGVAVDASGIYIADTENNIIRKVGGDGRIFTVAGVWPTRGHGGNDGPGTAALLAGPRGLALDGAQNLYIADTLAHQVRKLDLVTGVITAVAGVGEQVSTGDDDGPASCGFDTCEPARLNNPYDVKVAFGNVYIAEEGARRIRRVSEGFVQTIETGSESPLGAPSGVALDPRGNIYIAEPNRHQVRVIADGLGVFAGIANDPGFSGDGGNPRNARLSTPVALAADGDTFYIADLDNRRVRRVGVVPPSPDLFKGVMQFDNFVFRQISEIPPAP